MTAERRRRTPRSEPATLDAEPVTPPSRAPKATRSAARPVVVEVEPEEGGPEDLVEIRMAVGPDGLPQMITEDIFSEDVPIIERDLKLEQEVEREARKPLHEVIDEWGDATAVSYTHLTLPTNREV